MNNLEKMLLLFVVLHPFSVCYEIKCCLMMLDLNKDIQRHEQHPSALGLQNTRPDTQCAHGVDCQSGGCRWPL